MADHRGSYWKTLGAASIAAVGILAVMAWILGEGRLDMGAGLLQDFLGWFFLLLVLAVAFAWLMSVIIGGFISLHRDALEAQGIPYAHQDRRERVDGRVTTEIRRVLRAARLNLHPTFRCLCLRPGEQVEVKALDEILDTLDDRGTLDGLPFMPEMAVFCRSQFRVLRRVEKLNDWVWGTGLRRMRDMVLLDQLRCDGMHHGGCQAQCHIRWKEAWLRRVSYGKDAKRGAEKSPHAGQALVSEADLHRLANRNDDSGAIRYVCQVTELTAGSTPLAWADPRHYIRDLFVGNLRLRPFITGVSITMFNYVQRKRGGTVFPYRIQMPDKTSPHEILCLQPGEVVRVKSKWEIEKTLNSRFRNRGLWFDAEMFRHCGGEYRVARKVERLIDEKSGRLLKINNPCVTLADVTATGEYYAFCPENEAILWREIWLEKLSKN